jgi:hypothetical protein
MCFLNHISRERGLSSTIRLKGIFLYRMTGFSEIDQPLYR